MNEIGKSFATSRPSTGRKHKDEVIIETINKIVESKKEG